MIDPDDFVYENAPLIEVVAELRWNLVALSAVQNAAVDPLFGRASTRFTDAVGKLGYSHVERIVPREVPLEMVPYVPVLRFRRQANKWPLFQIGPGLFSANIVPPYEGWDDFRRVLKPGLEALDGSFGLGNELFEPSIVQLRYINGITEKLGLTSYAEFCAQDLSLSVPLPDSVAGKMVADPDSFAFAVEYTFALANSPSSRMTIKCSPGQANNQSAAIVELFVTQQGDLAFAKVADGIVTWLDNAHRSIRETFQLMTSDRLKQAMGPKRPVRRQ